MGEMIRDVVIVGGGPAGQAAAIVLQEFGLKIAVLDEQPRPGGQILRQPPRRFEVPDWLAGRSYLPLKRQLARFEALGAVEWLGSSSVVDVAAVEGGFAVHALGADGLRELTARRVLIAAGCQDLAVPLPGWTLPGVYAAGGIQAFVKSQQIVPGRRMVLAGTHPLQLLIADQVVRAGGQVAAVLFAQRLHDMARTLMRRSAAALLHLGDLSAAAAAFVRLQRGGVPVRFGQAVEQVVGDTKVRAVMVEGRAIDCDTVGLCYGFVPQSALLRMAGVAMRRAGPAGGWAAAHDDWMQTDRPGMFVAGETTGIAGAPAAMAAGEIAGLGIALDLRLIGIDEAGRRAAPVRRRHARRLAFAALLDAVADPTGDLPAPSPDTIACRCEDVTFAELDAAIAQGASANAVKLVTRCGMGVCQGRNCEPTLLRRLEAAGHGSDPGFTSRFPARPVMIGDVAARG